MMKVEFPSSVISDYTLNLFSSLPEGCWLVSPYSVAWESRPQVKAEAGSRDSEKLFAGIFMASWSQCSVPQANVAQAAETQEKQQKQVKGR